MAEVSLVLEPETAGRRRGDPPAERARVRPGAFRPHRLSHARDAAADLSLSFVARVGTLLVGANAMTPIVIGETPALLLGPLIVEPVFRSQGIGEALVAASLEAARAAGAKLVVLVGDEPYYARIGFKRAPPGRVVLAGPGRSPAPALLRIAARRLRGRRRQSAWRLGQSKMTIVVTGSAGHLGEALMRTLRAAGRPAIGIDLRPSPFTDRVGSINDRGFVGESLRGARVVVHCANLHKPHVSTRADEDFLHHQRRRDAACCSRRRSTRGSRPSSTPAPPACSARP